MILGIGFRTGFLKPRMELGDISSSGSETSLRLLDGLETYMHLTFALCGDICGDLLCEGTASKSSSNAASPRIEITRYIFRYLELKI